MHEEPPIGRSELLQGIGSVAVLLWINGYICRELFTTAAPHMASMHGFWMALARLGGGAASMRPTWWPYWDCGMPFEYTYQPLVPAATAAWAAFRNAPYQIAFQSISALVYMVLPVTLFVMAWLLTRRMGCAFFAGLLFSLASPSQLLAPDGSFVWVGVAGARRLYLQTAWDDTPHLAGLVLLPLTILFLARALHTRRLSLCVSAAVTLGLGSLATPFVPVDAAFAALCLWLVLPRRNLVPNILVTAAIGAFAWALAAPFYSPSAIVAIREAAANSYEGRWTAGSWTALALFILGWSILWHCLLRWTKDWRLQFFALFAYAMAAIPVLAIHLHRFFLPQPMRYKIELDIAVAILVVFTSEVWFKRLPRAVKVASILVFLALAGEQVVNHRLQAKELLRAVDVTRTIEYRASQWAAQNLRGVRIFMPGSIAQWTNTYTNIPQFSGGSWSTAYNQVQQRGTAAVYNGGDTPKRDSEISLAWLQAFGVGAVVVSGPRSEEFWKPFAHAAKFEGVLPVLWRENDVTIYQVSQRSTSLAHILSETAIVHRTPRSPGEIAPLKPFVAALQDPAQPSAGLRWEGRNRLRVEMPAAPGQALSIQVSYHPGWHARANGRTVPVLRDGLGLMYLRPACDSACEIILDYNGGWELRLCRYISFASLFALLLLLLRFLLRGFTNSSGRKPGSGIPRVRSTATIPARTGLRST